MLLVAKLPNASNKLTCSAGACTTPEAPVSGSVVNVIEATAPGTTVTESTAVPRPELLTSRIDIVWLPAVSSMTLGNVMDPWLALVKV